MLLEQKTVFWAGSTSNNNERTSF